MNRIPGLSQAARQAPTLSPEAQREPQAEHVAKQMTNLLERLDNLRSKVTGLADRTVGSRPEKAAGHEPSPPSNGLLDTLGQHIRSAHCMLVDIEAHIGRLEREGL